MCPSVLLEVAQGCEDFQAPILATVECFARVNSLVCLQPVKRVEGLLAARDVALIGSLVCVDPEVDLEAVRCQECLSAALLRAHESVFPCVCLLMSLEVPCSAVGPLAALKVAPKSLGLPFASLLVHALNRERGMRWVLGHRAVARIDLHADLVCSDGMLNVPA